MDDISKLKTKPISELREIAKAVGVKSPTTLKKEQLLEKIKEVASASTPKEESKDVNSDKITPKGNDTPSPKSKRGRPTKAKVAGGEASSKPAKLTMTQNELFDSSDFESTEVKEKKVEDNNKRRNTKRNNTTSKEKREDKSDNKTEETNSSSAEEHKPLTSREKWLMRQAQHKAKLEERKNRNKQESETDGETQTVINSENKADNTPQETTVAATPSEEVQTNYTPRPQKSSGKHNSPEFITKIVTEGVIELMPDGYGFIRSSDYNYLNSPDDVYVSIGHVREHGLKLGDTIKGEIRPPREGERYFALVKVLSINGLSSDITRDRVQFEYLTPLFPDKKFNITGGRHNNLSNRIIDMFSPIGMGQRALIVAPPKTGKTTLLKNLANAIADNHPEVYMIVLLIDERPEEVTDMERSVNAEVISSTFDEQATRHVKVAEMVLEKAKRMVECGHDVVIILDSITRLARAYNTVQPASGKVLSGGVDANALHRPKRFLGAARNTEEKGSLTIIASALIETGSKMDEVIFEEFKGTGNMELQLDRKISNKRIYPAVDLTASGTRREDLLVSATTVQKTWIVRRHIADMNSVEAIELIRKNMETSRNNEQMLEQLDQ